MKITYNFGERQIANKVLTKRVSPNRFGRVGPIDTSVRQRTNPSIGTSTSGFLQHTLQDCVCELVREDRQPRIIVQVHWEETGHQD
jgi:hypothetical protein